MVGIAPQFGPGSAGNVDAVAPVPLRDRQAAVATGRCDGAAVRARVLIDRRTVQRIPQDRQHLAKCRAVLHRAGTDSMEIGEHPALHLRVNVSHLGPDGIVGAHTGNADLADAPAVIVRRFDIRREETERALGKGRDICLPHGCRLRRWRRDGTKNRGKEAQAPHSSR